MRTDLTGMRMSLRGGHAPSVSHRAPSGALEQHNGFRALSGGNHRHSPAQTWVLRPGARQGSGTAGVDTARMRVPTLGVWHRFQAPPALPDW